MAKTTVPAKGQGITRRSAIKGLAGGAALAAAPPWR